MDERRGRLPIAEGQAGAHSERGGRRRRRIAAAPSSCTRRWICRRVSQAHLCRRVSLTGRRGRLPRPTCLLGGSTPASSSARELWPLQARESPAARREELRGGISALQPAQYLERAPASFSRGGVGRGDILLAGPPSVSLGVCGGRTARPQRVRRMDRRGRGAALSPVARRRRRRPGTASV